MALPVPAPDRTALITGASSGIGAELARQLASRGHGVTLVARREDRLRSLAEDLSSRHNVRAEVLAVDLTDLDARTSLPDRLESLGLEAAVLVNNAGFSTSGPVAKSDPAKEVAMIRTDVEAVAHLCSLFLPAMVRHDAGGILNVASTAAFQPLPGQSGYGACKAFVLSYTHGLRGELHGTKVAATVLCPGPVQTEFATTAGFTAADEAMMPGFMWVPAADVARQAIDGLASNRAVVIPGTANKMAAMSGYLTPRSVLVPMLARRHPSLHQHEPG